MQLASEGFKRSFIPNGQIVEVDLPPQHGDHALSGDPVAAVGADRGRRYAGWHIWRPEFLDYPDLALEVVSSRWRP